MLAQMRVVKALTLLFLLLTACSGDGAERGPGSELAGKTDPQKLVSIVSIRALSTSIGPVVLGEIRNRTKQPVQRVKVSVSLRDGEGKKIGEDFGFALADVIPPGEKAPFSIPFTVGRSAIGKLDASLEAVPGGSDRTAQLAISGQPKGRRTGPLYEITGTVRNSHSGDVRFPKVIATFYDKEGRVVGAESHLPEQEVLRPGETAEFRITLPERNQLIARFTLTAEASTEEPAEG